MWKDSDGVYGALRITAELGERYQISVNRKTVAKRMRLVGIEGISPRAFVPVTTIQAKRKSALPDLVRRMFDTGELNRVWMSDITYLRTGEGWLYLCAVCDGHSRRVLDWAMDSVQDSCLVEKRCGWRTHCAVTLQMVSCFTLTAERNLPASSFGRCAGIWALLSLWAYRSVFRYCDG
ncbi:IS3 family transposase [Corynebacterium pseudodiphtheriticum]|nr:IS3 family transposase [Corynebacterium pseudodiphtheriticum]MDK4305068.1 IS3 family transposase [Corynebacterium pseudodiphtheriticum]